MNKHRLGLRITYFVLVALLVSALGNPGAALAQDSTRFTAAPLYADSTIQMVKSSTNADSALVSVIVKLKGASLASYQGGLAGLPATSPSKTNLSQLEVSSLASQAYLHYLNSQHQNFIAAQVQSIPQARVTHDYTVILNAVALTLPADQLDALQQLPDVEAIYPDELLQPQTDNSPQFIGAPVIWSQLGGQESAGEGVVVGVIDSGIWPEHPSFSDPDPSGKPYSVPPPTLSGSARHCDFSGGVNPGPAFACNNKLIGAYNEMATYRSVQPLLASEFTSARDDDGHGTHTASTSAGNAGVNASIFGVSRGVVSGVAPRAHVIIYKVCGANGCYSSDSAASVQQAILDGVNVINFSISGGSNPYGDAVELAFLDAYNAGIFVAASAGNSGPGANTTDHRGPWVTTVAASTQNRAFTDTLTLTADGGASLALTGTSITSAIGPAPVAVPAPADIQCNTPFAPGTFTGKVVVCQRGTTGRVQKGYNVLQGGAVGMILYNQSTAVTDLETDNHFLPAAHIQYSAGQQVLAFIAGHTNVQASLTAGVKVAGTGDIMASFSSRGGAGLTLGVSKPDITAPGVQILAGASPQHLTPADGGYALGPQGEAFMAIAGTSMSSPHIAGSGALLKAQHPTWTPGQIKSALMTTAWNQVVKEDGLTPATPFDDGSGRVDLSKAGDPGLTFDVSPADYSAHSADLWNVNYPSVYLPALAGVITLQRTAHSLLSQPSTWSLSVTGATDFTVSVPAALVVPAGGNATFDITIDARGLAIGQVRSATLTLAEGAPGTRLLHLPITLVRKQAPITLNKTCAPATVNFGQNTTCTVTFQNTTLALANVNLVDQLPTQLSLVPASVSGAAVAPSGDTLTWSGNLVAATPANITIATGLTPTGYLPLSNFPTIPPIAGVGDDTVTNFNVPAFVYAGDTYTRLGVSSNGVIIVGGATSAADATPLNQNLPNAAAPNNVIAPFWTDLNPAAIGGGAIRIGTLTDGVHHWIVIDYAAVKEFSTAKTDTFEVWIGYDGVQDTSIAYGTVGGNGDAGLLTVGAENSSGNRGQNYYYNGTGTLPTATTQLVVTGAAAIPSPAHVVSYSAKATQAGKWVNYAQLTGYQFQGASIAAFPGEVVWPYHNYLPSTVK